jgi:hypothetical protein
MLEGLEPKKKNAACAVRKLMDTLGDKDSKILTDAVADVATWTSNALSTALRDRGIIVADHTITKHRNRICVCYRS